jgi:hypothetical protein
VFRQSDAFSLVSATFSKNPSRREKQFKKKMVYDTLPGKTAVEKMEKSKSPKRAA